jgi:2-oxoisovalerate dehydrogenase E1 component
MTRSASREEAFRLYETMLRIRLFETRAGELCRKGEMPAFLHLYIGEEATAAGVCSQLEVRDQITSTHRGHGHALAKGADPKRLMAELFGRATGFSGGRGGSMHIYAMDIGILGTNGLVGGGIPAAVGAGLCAKLQGTGGIAVAFFGDGAVNHGAFHESLNLAAALDVPVIFVCENNLYATATPLRDVTKNAEIATRAAAYGMPGVAVDGQDVFAVRDVARDAVHRARSGGGPTLIESKTYRFVGHHEGDPPVGCYRTADEIEQWKQRCPLKLMTEYLRDAEGITDTELDECKTRIADEVEQAVEFARRSPWPDVATLTDHVLAPPRRAGSGMAWD